MPKSIWVVSYTLPLVAGCPTIRSVFDSKEDAESFVLNGQLQDVVVTEYAAAAPEPVAHPTMQMLIDAGLNGFAFELVSESLAGKKDIKTFNRLRFEFRGVIYTLEPAVQREEAAHD